MRSRTGADARPRASSTASPSGTTSSSRPRAGATAAKLTITDHPNGGPVFSGPQLQPWHCPDGATTRRATSRRSSPTSTSPPTPQRRTSSPYDRANPPSDVASTTTDEGMTVPFVVRQELGYQGPRPVQGPDALHARPGLEPLEAPGAVEPQARHHGRRRVRRGPRRRHRAAQRLQRDHSVGARLHAELQSRRSAVASRSCRQRSTTTGHNCNLADGARPSR